MSVDSLPTTTQFIGLKLSSMLAKRRLPREHKAITRALTLESIVRFMLHVAGFACLTYAAFRFNVPAGYCVAGVSCFIMSRLMVPDTEEAPDNHPTANYVRR